jgi:hypothetical protein
MRRSAETLWTASLAIVYSTAEYCGPVWLNDVQLDNIMWLISGTVKSMQLQWLPMLTNRKHRPIKTATWSSHCSWTGELQKACEVSPVRTGVGYSRSKVDFSQICVEFWSRSIYVFSIPDAWTATWSASLPVNGDLIMDPNFRLPGSTYDYIFGRCWTALEPSSENARTSCIDGGSWSHQLVTVVLRNKQSVT